MTNWGSFSVASEDHPAYPMNDVIPSDVLELLRECVPSFEGIEALLFLRSEAHREWPSLYISEKLVIPVAVLEISLDVLADRGLIARNAGSTDVTWRYAPADTSRDDVVTKLADLYEARRLDVMRVLTDLAVKRIRGQAARVFADSFVIQRKKRN